MFASEHGLQPDNEHPCVRSHLFIPSAEACSRRRHVARAARQAAHDMRQTTPSIRDVVYNIRGGVEQHTAHARVLVRQYRPIAAQRVSHSFHQLSPSDHVYVLHTNNNTAPKYAVEFEKKGKGKKKGRGMHAYESDREPCLQAKSQARFPLLCVTLVPPLPRSISDVGGGILMARSLKVTLIEYFRGHEQNST
jgi:hypothetical protein